MTFCKEQYIYISTARASLWQNKTTLISPKVPAGDILAPFHWILVPSMMGKLSRNNLNCIFVNYLLVSRRPLVCLTWAIFSQSCVYCVGTSHFLHAAKWKQEDRWNKNTFLHTWFSVIQKGQTKFFLDIVVWL